MRLDVLGSTTTTDPQRVLALADQAYADYCAAGTTAEQIDLGLAVCSPQFDRVFDANRIFFARVPRGADAARLWDDAKRHYQERRTRLWRLMLARLAPTEETEPLIDVIRKEGWREIRFDIMRLTHATPRDPSRYRILSARAAMSLYEPFAREAAATIQPQLADASLARLDDPLYDALVAIEDGRVVARAALMTSGEVGLIEQVHVLQDYRGRGIGRAVVEASIDLCARAQFKHVVLTVDQTNDVAKNLYASLGFTKLGEEITFGDPATLS
jgi:ribosomal protein S18 acetylase RimI-like enzyme